MRGLRSAWRASGAVLADSAHDAAHSAIADVLATAANGDTSNRDAVAHARDILTRLQATDAFNRDALHAFTTDLDASLHTSDRAKQ